MRVLKQEEYDILAHHLRYDCVAGRTSPGHNQSRFGYPVEVAETMVSLGYADKYTCADNPKIWHIRTNAKGKEAMRIYQAVKAMNVCID